MGFTLRAALDLLPPAATVIVSELVPALVDWNRGPLGALARHPLRDKRVVIEVGDVGALLLGSPTGSTPSCSTWTTAPPHSPPQATPISTAIAGSPSYGLRSSPTACWASGRHGKIDDSSTPPLRRLRRDRGTRERPPQERRTEAYYFHGHCVASFRLGGSLSR